MNYFLKKSAILSLLILFMVSTTQMAFAQLELGVGGVYGTELEEPGFNARVVYNFGERFRISPGFDFFFPSEDKFAGGETELKIWSINLDGNYLLGVGSEVFYLYGLAGLNITSQRLETKLDDGNGGFQNEISEENSTEVGVNIGIGTELHIGRLRPFAEFKYVISEFDQAVIGLGIRVRVNTQ